MVFGIGHHGSRAAPPLLLTAGRFDCLKKGSPARALGLVFLLVLAAGAGCQRRPAEPTPTGAQTSDAVRPVPKPLISRSAYEDDVLEAVFRHQFGHDASGLQWRARVFFLSVYDRDPSNNLMDRFERHEPPVKRVSECEISAKARGTSAIWVVDSNTGEPGLIYRVERITWVSDAEAEVTGGYYAGGRAGSGNLYRVVREGEEWVVKKDTPQWVS
jgi:hypothetical protein